MSLFLDQSVSFAQAISQLRDLPILVLGHRRPDGDCIGSQVAMTRVLLALGKNVRAVNHDPIPRTLLKFVVDTPFCSPEQVADGDYQIITVDCADHARVGEVLLKRFRVYSNGLVRDSKIFLNSVKKQSVSYLISSTQYLKT